MYFVTTIQIICWVFFLFIGPANNLFYFKLQWKGGGRWGVVVNNECWGLFKFRKRKGNLLIDFCVLYGNFCFSCTFFQEKSFTGSSRKNAFFCSFVRNEKQFLYLCLSVKSQFKTRFMCLVINSTFFFVYLYKRKIYNLKKTFLFYLSIVFGLRVYINKF